MNLDLFSFLEKEAYSEQIAPDAVILHGFARPTVSALLVDLKQIIIKAPLRHMLTPSGFIMSVAMTNCGQYGWISERKGYRYDSIDPLSGQKWPAMPTSFFKTAILAAKEAGFPDFNPDACLINKYSPQAKLSLHQDKDEKNLDAPIVSLSLGIPALFLFGGLERREKTNKFLLEHADVVVWGGVSRLAYHGILPLKEAHHPLLGNCRINLTFRQSK